jgi:hypothetical protein
MVVFLFSVPCHVVGQFKDQGLLNPDETFNNSRFNAVVICEAVVATIATIGLQYLWYKEFPRSHFHFFNDNKEWLGMDKLGHATTAYNIAAAQYDLMRWSGVDSHSALLIGGLTGLGFLTMIEIMDGFSGGWGFSPGDMMANVFGSSLFMVQQSYWHQQRIQLRYSFHQSPYAKYNPAILGKNFVQQLLKDYNGQSYWFSFNISSFVGSENNFPKWLNADFGFGAEGMIGATNNPSSVNDITIPAFVRQRKILFGAGAAFAKPDQIPFPSWINTLRIPTPVLEWKTKTKDFVGHFLYH